MNIATGWSRIDVIVHTEPAEWWQIVAAFTPLAVLLVLVVAAVIVVRAVRPGSQGEEETRAEWWNRAVWAMDMALDDKPERRNIGLAVLEQLSTSHLVGKEEAQILVHARGLLSR